MTTDPTVNLTPSDKRKVVEGIVLAFLKRAGIHTTIEPTDTGLTLHLDLEHNIVLPEHLARLAK